MVNKIDRRTFLKMMAAAAVVPAVPQGCISMSPRQLKMKSRKKGIRITGATVITMKKGESPRKADITIRENKIVKITPPGKDDSPVEKTIEAGGKFIIPALIDSHAHITQMRMMSAPVMDPLFMATGVTTVRDMATADAEWDNDDFAPGFDDPEFQGPRVIKVAGFFDGPPGVFSWAIIPESKKEVDDYIDEIADNRIKAIKIYSYMTAEMMSYIKKAADKKGLYIAGHVPLCMSAIEAADAGIQEFEHNFCMADTILNEKDKSFFRNMRSFGHKWMRLEKREDDVRKLARDLAMRDIINVPTLVVMRGLGYSDLPDLRKDPRMRYLPEFVPESIWGIDNPMLQCWSADDFAVCRKSIPMSGMFTRMMKEEGAVILAGTDTPGSLAIPGFGLHDELKCLVEYSGFTPEEALSAATRVPSEVIGIDDKIGTVEEGKIADMLILDDNPLKDISATEKIRAIIFNGKIAEREAIDEHLKAMEEEFHGFIYSGIISNCVKWGSNIGFSFLIPDPPGGWENQ